MHTFNYLLNEYVANFQNFELAFTALIFVIAFLESFALIGYIMPGTILLYAGAVIALKKDFIPHFIIASTLAGMLADAISFYLGLKGNAFITKHTHRYEKLLQKTHQFFQKYGALTIIIGKISGTLRPLTAFVAGTSRMEIKKYFTLATIANIITSALYVIVVANFKKYIAPIAGSLIALGPLFLFIVGAYYILRQKYRPSSHPYISHLQEKK